MDIRIGENIKRLRGEKGVTQEQLAEILHVSSVAVSKWERGETMPDISLLPQLAFYFQTTIDELMNYDACAVELQIKQFIQKHTEAAAAYQNELCLQLAKEAFQAYPNDYRVMLIYMWDLIGGAADNDDAVIRQHSGELNNLCNRILAGCRDATIRADAHVIRGKILKAEGHAEEALALYRSELPDWYRTAGQKCEQLFAKGTPEFATLLRENITQLLRLALNKKSKEIWFCMDGSAEEKARQAAAFCDALQTLAPFFPDGSLPGLISYFAEDFTAKLQYLANADEKTIEKIQPYIGMK